jgi:isoquinoline 1-oxidoreductase subunit beta
VTTPREVSRRDFVKTSAVAGAGLLIGFSFSASACAPAHLDPADPPVPLDAWIRVGTDDTVTLMVDRSEMGQGVATALPMLLAEELEADWTTIAIEFAPAAVVYYNTDFGAQGTGGSSSVRVAFTSLRQAGASAREVLVSAAAARWNANRSECRAENGAVIHTPTKRRLTYGALAESAARLPLPKDVPLKDPRDWKIIGTPAKRLDTPPKVDGSAVFGMDVKVPGMLVAVVARPPVFGGKVVSFDPARARAVPGVRDVVQISSGVAVVASGYWPAHQGRAALDVKFDDGPNADVSTQSIRDLYARHAEHPGHTALTRGQPEHAPAGAAIVEAVYELPLLAHATMEPMNCTADVRADGVDIWAPTQIQTWVQQYGARIGGVPLDRVNVHTTYLGGGFGRRVEMDFVTDALEASKAMKSPVKVIYSREDDVQHDFYRCASRHQLRGALDAHGNPVLWTHRVAAQSSMAHFWPESLKDGYDAELVEGAMAMPYAIPNVRVDSLNVDTGIPVGFWRSVNNSYNGFAVETFVDELAHAARRDPYEFRRDLLGGSPRHLRALNLAAEKAGWGTPLPSDRARGIAVHLSFQSYVAEVAEVAVERDGAVRVHRVVCAVDCGPVVNPAIVESQMESAIVYGLTAALWGEITIDRGRAVQGNFDTYRMLRMKEMPKIEVYIVPSTDPQGGAGEPGTPPIAPAVCNAIFALTGKRIRKLPVGRVG